MTGFLHNIVRDGSRTESRGAPVSVRSVMRARDGGRRPFSSDDGSTATASLSAPRLPLPSSPSLGPVDVTGTPRDEPGPEPTPSRSNASTPAPSPPASADRAEPLDADRSPNSERPSPTEPGRTPRIEEESHRSTPSAAAPPSRTNSPRPGAPIAESGPPPQAAPIESARIVETTVLSDSQPGGPAQPTPGPPVRPADPELESQTHIGAMGLSTDRTPGMASSPPREVVVVKHDPAGDESEPISPPIPVATAPESVRALNPGSPPAFLGDRPAPVPPPADSRNVSRIAHDTERRVRIDQVDIFVQDPPSAAPRRAPARRSGSSSRRYLRRL